MSWIDEKINPVLDELQYLLKSIKEIPHTQGDFNHHQKALHNIYDREFTRLWSEILKHPHTELQPLLSHPGLGPVDKAFLTDHIKACEGAWGPETQAKHLAMAQE